MISRPAKDDAALRDAVAKYEAILASTLDPVITIDERGTIVTASRSVSRVFGYGPDELVGQDIGVLMPEPYRSAHGGYLSRYRRTGQTHILGKTREFEAVRKDGSRVPIELSVSRVDVPGRKHPLFTGIIHDLTERRQVEEALRQSEGRFRQLAEAMPQIVWTASPDGRIEYFNRRWYEFTGLDYEERGLQDAEQIIRQVVHEEDQAAAAARWREVLASGDALEQELRLRHAPSGEYRWHLARALPVRDERWQIVRWFGTCTDIDGPKRVERELRLIQTLTSTVSMAPGLGQALESALRTVCAATGWDYAEAWFPAEDQATLVPGPCLAAPGLDLTEFRRVTAGTSMGRGEGLPGRVWASGRPELVPDLNDPGAPTFLRLVAARDAGLTGALAVPILVGDTVDAVLAFFTRQPFRADRRLVNLVCAALAPLGPVIERKRAEDALARHLAQLERTIEQRTSELKASHERLRQADRLVSIGTLAAGIGHDMNNVLLPVRCQLDAMEARGLPEALHAGFDSVRRSLGYLQELSDGLHLLALNPEDPEATTGLTRLPEWWAQVGALLRRALPKRSRFKVTLHPDLPPVGVAPHRLTQAVLNLVINAGEAIGPKGCVRLSARAGLDEHTVEIAVGDDGEGMTEEVRRRAIDPFFTTKKRGMGTGLGLSLVHGVVHGAGGSMVIESAPGKGTTVRLSLPAVGEVAERAPAAEGDALRAAVAVRDRRLSAFIGEFLRASGIQVHAEGRDPGDAHLWVTDPAPGSARLAGRFLRQPGRRIVVIGRASPWWRRKGVTVLARADDFEAVRRSIGEAAAAAQGRDE